MLSLQKYLSSCLSSNICISELYHNKYWNVFFFAFLTESTDGIVPTIGFQNSSFSLYKFQVTLFDVGGGPRIRSIWKIYYADVRSYS